MAGLTVLGLTVSLVVGCGGRARTVPPTAAVASEVRFDADDYRLVWPLPIVSTARVTSQFGSRKDPFTGLVSFHSGIDLDGSRGGPVYAAGAAKVTYAGFRLGYGNLLILEHGNGLSTWYGHCATFRVKKGQRVRRGQIIAGMGDSGRATGVHLHFEVRKYGRPVDPVQLLPTLKSVR